MRCLAVARAADGSTKYLTAARFLRQLGLFVNLEDDAQTVPDR
jgi:hypothetical protein